MDRSTKLSAAALRRRFTAHLQVKPWIYWCDLLASTTVGWTAFVVAGSLSPGSVGRFFSMLVATLALYRAVLFIHELAHMKRGAIKGFEAVWNLLAGFPLLVPSVMYVGPHTDHHRRKKYGTSLDPEYEPIALWSPARILATGFSLLFVPAALPLRWGILGPVSWVVPPFRKLLIERASTLLINTRYRRELPEDAQEIRKWRIQEVTVALVVWSVAAAVATGALAPVWLLQWYCMVTAILMINHARTLAAHRYENEEEVLDDVGLLLDSVNLMGRSWLTALAAPVGLRYHALHHLLPALPYHSLGQVHRHLVDELPADSPYREAAEQGILATLRSLLERAHERRMAAGIARSVSARDLAARNVTARG